MTYYIRNGNTVQLSDEAAIDIQTVLSPGNYIVKFDQQNSRFFLEETDKFTSLPKYYGKVMTHVDRIHNTFADRPSGTGVMLVGEKGSGKTLLAKELAIKGYELGIPTLLVNQDWCGDIFNKFIQDIDQPAIIIFDEFEKIFDDKKQEEVLTLFDGVYPSKKLFIISCNDTWKINSHMRNRPGRFYYYMPFGGLEREFILEYCRDNDLSDEYTRQVANFSDLFTNFNFDMLKAIVEESKRYNESPAEVIAYINARPESDSNNAFEVHVFIAGKQVKNCYPSEFTKNPLSEDTFQLSFYADPELVRGVASFDESDDELDYEEDKKIKKKADAYVRMSFTANELKSYDNSKGLFVYRKGPVECQLIRKQKALYDWAKLL